MTRRRHRDRPRVRCGDRHRQGKDVVIVTDGKSYAFAPHTIARTGIRVTAVLIGDDALEAGIAHLAGMTGGQVFIATGSDAAPDPRGGRRGAHAAPAGRTCEPPS